MSMNDLHPGCIPTHAQCSRNRILIHQDPDQNKAVTENELINEWMNENCVALFRFAGGVE